MLLTSSNELVCLLSPCCVTHDACDVFLSFLLQLWDIHHLHISGPFQHSTAQQKQSSPLGDCWLPATAIMLLISMQQWTARCCVQCVLAHARASAHRIDQFVIILVALFDLCPAGAPTDGWSASCASPRSCASNHPSDGATALRTMPGRLTAALSAAAPASSWIPQ